MQLRIFIIVKQYLVIGISALCHHSCTNLAKTYAVSPPCAIKNNATGDAVIDITQLYGESRTIKMTFRKRTTDFEFFTNHKLLFATYDAKFLNASARPALYGLKVENISKIFFTTLSKEF